MGTGSPIPPDASRRPLRIAMISYYLPSTSKMGVGYQAHALATELVDRGHTVHLYSDCPAVEGAVYEHRQVEVPAHLRTFAFAAALRRIDFSGYDAIHAHGDDYWLWRRRAPVHVRTMHGSCFEEARRITGAKERIRMLLLGCSEVLATVVADRTVAVSPETRRWYPWVRSVIPNGVDLQRFKADPERRSTTPIVLFVGSWRGRKRGEELARQFCAVVRPSIPEAELWMVSRDVPDDAGPGVRALGALSEEELIAAFQEASVFCLPSDYEGFGIPYAEAMATGLPVVATPNVGARYVTDDGRAGVLVELGEVGSALRSLLEDPDRRQELTRRGLGRVELFDLRRVAADYEAIYTAPVERRWQSLVSKLRRAP